MSKNVPMKTLTRTEGLCRAFGWQGGTIHQVSEATGCSVQDLLHADLPKDLGMTSQYGLGWFAGRTNPATYNVERIFPHYQGNLPFWLGVAEGLRIP